MRKRTLLTFFTLLLCGLAGLGAHLYRTWAESRRHEAERPREAVAGVVSRLLVYYEKRGQFPPALSDLEGVAWQKNFTYGAGGNTLQRHNYHYLYTRQNAQRATLWAVPVGARREEGATYFTYLTREGLWRWQGGPLTEADARQIKPLPNRALLILLGLAEQTPIPFPQGPTQKALAAWR
jgi:hypothetical protein